MTLTTFSSRDFNQNVSQAKRAANNGPVYITDRGTPSHVLLSIGDYEKLAFEPDVLRKTADLLSMPADAEGIDFEPPRMGDDIFRDIDLSDD